MANPLATEQVTSLLATQQVANRLATNQVTSLLATQQVANRLATNQVTEEEDEVCRPLGKPAHEVAVPILTVRHEHPEPETVRGDAPVQGAPDPVEHLDLEPLARDPLRPGGVAGPRDQLL